LNYILDENNSQTDNQLLRKRALKTLTPHQKVAQEKKKLKATPARSKSVKEKAMKHYMLGCCKSSCLWTFSLQSCIQYHQFIASKTQVESKSWLRSKLAAGRLVTNGSESIQILVEGHNICRTAFKLLYGISNNKFYAAMKDFDNPVSIVTHGNLGNRNASNETAKENMYNWVMDFIAEAGDCDPTNTTIHIP
jgi:hypothetical protein